MHQQDKITSLVVFFQLSGKHLRIATYFVFHASLITNKTRSITMSLFGSSPDESHAPALSSKSRNSLFDDEPSPAPGSKSSLFADDDDASGSPWAMPTPKKSGRGDLLKNLLPSSDVPDFYIDLFDRLVKGEDGAGGSISAAGITKVLSAGRLAADQQSRIMNIMTSGGKLQNLGRNEFNVLLALIGLAQEEEDITLDSVDERRRSHERHFYINVYLLTLRRPPKTKTTQPLPPNKRTSWDSRACRETSSTSSYTPRSSNTENCSTKCCPEERFNWLS